MEQPAPSTALAKRPSSDVMPPPPPPKRIKRPPKVLDEDDYTDALSKIIARDFFPGLLESQKQKEYLDALESRDPTWIASAEEKLKHAMTPRPNGRRRGTRLNTDGTPGRDAWLGSDTPKGWQGATPMSTATEQIPTEEKDVPATDTASLSLSAFQAKYTSEDNESFNALLDKQNLKRREKYAFLWNNNKIPAPRQIAQCTREAKMLKESEESDGNSNALALITGATASRPARPDGWKAKPDNTLMFAPSGVEDEMETVAEKAATESRAAPKQTVYQNTRLPPPALANTDRPTSPTQSSIHAAISGRPRVSASESSFAGSETPRVNGYAFVDEEEPHNIPQPPPESSEPSYRDLLAGQTGSDIPNPFKISENRRREDLHHQMVEKTNRKKREAKADTTKTPVPKFPSSPMVGRDAAAGATAKGGAGSGGPGGMTPAAQRLLERVGKMPRPGGKGEGDGGGSGLRNMWTPTPRAKRF